MKKAIFLIMICFYVFISNSFAYDCHIDAGFPVTPFPSTTNYDVFRACLNQCGDAGGVACESYPHVDPTTKKIVQGGFPAGFCTTCETNCTNACGAAYQGKI